MHMPQTNKDYEAESDLRTLIEAVKIKKDKKRHAAAMKKRGEMKADLDKIGDKK